MKNAQKIRIAPAMAEIRVGANTISTDFAGGITYTAEGIDKYKEDYLKECFAWGVALCSKRWQLEDLLNAHFNLNGRIS